MLDPRDRGLLLEMLRPPSGYRLDFAVATTFSLDLLALLTAPLAFTFFDWEDDEGRPVADPLALLEAIRRNANRLALFCQAGRISVPKQRDQPLFSYLENCVHEVAGERPTAVFHPKVWVLRYTAEAGPVRYRVLCLSRNLTFDRSWDTALVLDGELVDRKNAFSRNHPLADFVAALPTLATRPPATATIEQIDQIQNELRRVQFEPPPGYEDIAFWPLGIPGHTRWPIKGRVDRMLVLSPFVAPAALARLAVPGRGDILISRLDELSKLDAVDLAVFEKVLAMSPEADGELSDIDDEDEADERAMDGSVPHGLHAKIFIADAGWDARVWVGSANATNAAFDANVEFLVELTGKRSTVGIDAFLAEGDGQTTFASLLQDFEPLDQPGTIDPDEKRAEALANETRHQLSRMGLMARVVETDDPERFSVALVDTGETRLAVDDRATVTVWPITTHQDTTGVVLAPTNDPVALFPKLSVLALTSFFGVEIEARHGDSNVTLRFVLNIPIENPPAQRAEAILRSILGDRDRVLRFLLMLLADQGTEGPPDMMGKAGAFGEFEGGLGTWGATLFESLVRSLARSHERIDQVADLVADLRKAPETAKLLPDDFDDIWEPIWAARLQARE